MSITTAGATKRSAGMASFVQPDSEKWTGASRCVPRCSGVQKRAAAYQLPASSAPQEIRSNSNGLPVGQYKLSELSGWVRSTTRTDASQSAGLAGGGAGEPAGAQATA